MYNVAMLFPSFIPPKHTFRYLPISLSLLVLPIDCSELICRASVLAPQLSAISFPHAVIYS